MFFGSDWGYCGYLHYFLKRRQTLRLVGVTASRLKARNPDLDMVEAQEGRCFSILQVA